MQAQEQELQISDILPLLCQFDDYNIVYIGVGTQFYGNKNWETNQNQQFPQFIRDLKNKIPSIKVLIVLIDPSFVKGTPPYIVTSNDINLKNTWTKSKYYSNLYHSSSNVDVIQITDSVNWSNVINNDFNNDFKFERIMIELCDHISNSVENTLLFYHEFTGSNVKMLENIIKKHIKIDDNKICIDITNGSKLSCYVDLAMPESYPVIICDKFNNLRYINPDTLSIDEKKELFNNSNI